MICCLPCCAICKMPVFCLISFWSVHGARTSIVTSTATPLKYRQHGHSMPTCSSPGDSQKQMIRTNKPPSKRGKGARVKRMNRKSYDEWNEQIGRDSFCEYPVIKFKKAETINCLSLNPNQLITGNVLLIKNPS